MDIEEYYHDYWRRRDCRIKWAVRAIFFVMGMVLGKFIWSW